jgi:hypothetical protein
VKLAGFFSAKLRKHQVTWLPCEIEALSIGAAVKQFSPFIVQSYKMTCVLTDSQPCVQSIQKQFVDSSLPVPESPHFCQMSVDIMLL